MARKQVSSGDTPSRVRPKSRADWRAWLQKNHMNVSSVWVVYMKAHARADGGLAYVEAVEEALCFGWIDGRVKPIDADSYMQMFTPRKPASMWAATNKARVERLMADGLMTEAGLRVVEQAKARGTWGALDHVEAMKVPPELQRAINANAAAKKNWPTFSPSARKGFLYWLSNAKRADTRATRIAQIVEMVAKKVRLDDLQRLPPSVPPGKSR